MKLSHALWGHPRREGMVEQSNRMWSTGEGNGKPLQYSCLENPMNSMKRQNDRIPKEELPRSLGAQYATGDQWRNNSRKNEGMEPKQKQYPVVDVTGDRSKVQCCKEQYCIGTWNVRSMNQGKLDGCESEWTLGDGDGQGGLACCDSWGHRVGHDWATEMNWTELNWGLHSPTQWPQPQVWVLNLWNMACLNWDVLQIWNNRFWRCRYSEYLMNICIPTVHIFCSCRLKW